jgi:hypothetical protein
LFDDRSLRRSFADQISAVKLAEGPLPVTTKLSAREWYGILLGASWGLVLGMVPFNRGGLFAVVLLGPPVAYLFLPKRPFLSWQVSIVAAAISTAMMERDPQDPNDSLALLMFLAWLGYTLFSAPWPYVLRGRALVQEEGGGDMRASLSRIGVGLLVFLACGLILLGFALTSMGVIYTTPESRMTAADRAAPLVAFAMATVGIGLAIYLCRNASRLGINKSVEDLIGLLLALVLAIAVPIFFLDLHSGRSNCPPSDTNCALIWPTGEIFLDSVICLEAIAALVWLIRSGKHGKTA